MNQLAPERRRSRISRLQILDTASHLLQEHGAQGVSIRKIASLIPCAPPSIYYYFKNKEEILDAMVDAPLTELIDRLALESGNQADAKSLLLSYADFWLLHRRQMSLLFLPGHWGQQSIFNHPKYSQIENAIESALGGDSLRAEGYLGLVNGLLFKVQNSDIDEKKAHHLVEQTLTHLL